eukprot:gene25587-11240_t
MRIVEKFFALLLVFARIFHRFFVHPIAHWWDDYFLGVWEELIRAFIRQVFGEIQRFLNGSVAFVLSLFNYNFRDTLRKTWDGSSDWQRTWQRGAERPSTLNSLVAAMYPGSKATAVGSVPTSRADDSGLESGSEGREPERTQSSRMSGDGSTSHMSSFQQLISRAFQFMGWSQPVRERRVMGLRKTRSYPNVTAVREQGKIARQRKRSFVGIRAEIAQRGRGDMFVQQSGDGLLEDTKILLELAVIKCFAAVRAFIRRYLLLVKKDASLAGSSASLAGAQSFSSAPDEILGTPGSDPTSMLTTPGLSPNSVSTGRQPGGGLNSLRRTHSSGNLENLRTLRKAGPQSASDVIRLAGYPLEVFTVTTQDGYILTMERIPRPGCKDVVFFMHGVLDTSLGWISCGNPKVQSGVGYWRFTVNDIGLADVSSQLDRIHDVKCRELGAGQVNIDLTSRMGPLAKSYFSKQQPSCSSAGLSPTYSASTCEASASLTRRSGQASWSSSAPFSSRVEERPSLWTSITNAFKWRTEGAQASAPPSSMVEGDVSLAILDEQLQALLEENEALDLDEASGSRSPGRSAGEGLKDSSVTDTGSAEGSPPFKFTRMRSSNSDGSLRNMSGNLPSSSSLLSRKVTLQVPQQGGGSNSHTVNTFTLSACSELTHPPSPASNATSTGAPAATSRAASASSTQPVMTPSSQISEGADNPGCSETSATGRPTSSSSVVSPFRAESQTPLARGAGSKSSLGADAKTSSPPPATSASNRSAPQKGAAPKAKSRDWFGSNLFKRSPSHGNIHNMPAAAGPQSTSRASFSDGIAPRNYTTGSPLNGKSPPDPNDPGSMPPWNPNGSGATEPHSLHRKSDTDAAAMAAGEPYRLRAVGHSLGGMALLIHTVMRARAGLPTHVHRLILLTPAGFHKDVPRATGPLLYLMHPILRLITMVWPMFAMPVYIPTAMARLFVFKLFADVRAIPSIAELQRLIISFSLNGDPSQWDRAMQMPHYSEVSMPAMSVHVIDSLSALQMQYYSEVFMPALSVHVIECQVIVWSLAYSELSMPAMSVHVIDGLSALQMLHSSEVSMPAMSVHVMLHMAQLARSGCFCLFDYGSRAANSHHYNGLPCPPDVADEYFYLRDVGIPVDLVAGQRDGIISSTNVKAHLEAMQDAGVKTQWLAPGRNPKP